MRICRGSWGLPRRLGVDAGRSVPRVPLYVLAVAATPLFACLVAGVGTTEQLVRATSACFIAVYAVALASAARILGGAMRRAAAARARAVVRELRGARDAAADTLG